MTVADAKEEMRRRWAAYYYPDGESGVLRNLLDIRRHGALRAAEYRFRASRQGELDRGEVTVPRTFGVAHMRALHHQLLQDVYAWAGQFRDVDLSKADAVLAPYEEIPERLERVQDLVTARPWAGVTRPEFMDAMAEILAQQNYTHPFREGNGVVTKNYLKDVAELSPYRLDFDRVTKADWDRACARSRPSGPAYEPDPRRVRGLFAATTVPRDPEPVVDPVLARAVELHQSTHRAGPDVSTTGTEGAEGTTGRGQRLPPRGPHGRSGGRGHGVG